MALGELPVTLLAFLDAMRQKEERKRGRGLEKRAQKQQPEVPSHTHSGTENGSPQGLHHGSTEMSSSGSSTDIKSKAGDPLGDTELKMASL